jgi:hypothetical protein
MSVFRRFFIGGVINITVASELASLRRRSWHKKVLGSVTE